MQLLEGRNLEKGWKRQCGSDDNGVVFDVAIASDSWDGDSEQVGRVNLRTRDPVKCQLLKLCDCQRNGNDQMLAPRCRMRRPRQHPHAGAAEKGKTTYKGCVLSSPQLLTCRDQRSWRFWNEGMIDLARDPMGCRERFHSG